jgi:hypothetical protein
MDSIIDEYSYGSVSMKCKQENQDGLIITDVDFHITDENVQ